MHLSFTDLWTAIEVVYSIWGKSSWAEGKTKKIEQRFKAPGLAFERGPTRSTLRQVAAEIGDDKKCLRWMILDTMILGEAWEVQREDK